MTTYTAIFQSFQSGKADDAGDEAGIEDVLTTHGARNVQFQLGNPNSKKYKLVQFEADLVLADVEYAMKNAFQLGMGPIHLVEGNFTDMRSWAQDAMLTDVWTDQAIINATTQHADDQALLALISAHSHQTYRTFDQLHKDPSNTYPLLAVIRDLRRQVDSYRAQPDKDELDRRRAELEAQMAGMIERYAEFHKQWVQVIFGMNPDTMAKHPMYQGNSGLLNLHLQDVINWYRQRYAPTGDHGEYMDGSDQVLGDFASTLINFLDGEWDLSQHAQFKADEYLMGLGYDPYNMGGEPLQVRYQLYKTLDARFHDEYYSGMSEIQRQLGLDDEDVA